MAFARLYESEILSDKTKDSELTRKRGLVANTRVFDLSDIVYSM